MKRARPFVFLNAAMTADGKLAPASRHFEPFAGRRDQEHLLELRATADAVMAGARTVDLARVNLGPGPARYRRLRRQGGLAEYNLRIIVSGAASLDPAAEVFRHRFSPIIVLTSERAPALKRRRLAAAGAEVKVCGQKEIDFPAALAWLGEQWGIKRLLCEGGGELNAALFAAGVVDEIHLTIAPLVLGGRAAPTLSDGAGFQSLAAGPRFRLRSLKEVGPDLFLIYRKLIVPKLAAGRRSFRGCAG